MAVKKDERCLRVGVLGCGPIAQFAHLESAQKARNVVLHAVCDVDRGLAERFGAFYDAARIYLDFDAMLADPEVEAVVVATADELHVSACSRALAAGKHVLCEKPLGTTVEEVTRLEREVTASGRVLQVGHMLRFDPGIEAARDFIQDGMGQLLAVKAWYCDSTHRYAMTDALQPLPRLGTASVKPPGDPKADRRRYYMLAHGSHLVDLARLLGGPIRSVRARLAERFGAHCWFIDVEFEGGALGHLDLTVAVRMDWHEGFQVYGERGSALGKIFNPWYYRASEVELFDERDASFRRLLGADAHFYRRQLEGFADAVLGKATLRGASITDGVAAVRAMAAIAASARTGEAVALADAVGGP